MAVSRAVFLDKDGTLVGDVPYNAAPGGWGSHRAPARACGCSQARATG